jgi:hypothetical protein
MSKIAIIGGGVAGVTTALLLDEEVSVFEKQSSLISGPPFCHLHAGGNLYPQISIDECIDLLKDSIEFIKIYPYSIDYRPTILAFPKNYSIEPKNFIKRLQILQKEYEKLVKEDISNKVLGEPKNYFKAYDKKDLLDLAKLESVKEPKSFDDWMIPFAKNINLDSLQYPVFIVNEFGLNMFRLASGAQILLNKKKNCNLLLNSEVIDIKKDKDKFVLTYLQDGVKKEKEFDYLINAAGFNSHKIDLMLGFYKERFIEFKAAYISKWDSKERWPEIIFHGNRGTKDGMAQFTPYFGGYFQLHGMSKDITLFNNGLIKSSKNKTSLLPKEFLEKIDFGWSEDLATIRTKRAIEHFKKYFPKFANGATVTTKPLYGAQQIPGGNPELRAAKIDFVGNNYARCEIVKVSTAPAMVKEIVKKFNLKTIKINSKLDDLKVTNLAKQIAQSRNYPSELGEVVNKIKR